MKLFCYTQAFRSNYMYKNRPKKAIYNGIIKQTNAMIYNM